MKRRTVPVKKLIVQWGNETEHGSPCWMIKPAGSKKWETLVNGTEEEPRYPPADFPHVRLEKRAFAWARWNSVPLAPYVDVHVVDAS